MTSESYRTSFYGLSGATARSAGLTVDRIEIPLFQRDFAQGRRNARVGRIRADFLAALYGALESETAPSVGLDFVYGGVEEGTLKPLDGQQRLTTLFLLHWYLASRSGHLAADHGWKRFSYATRQSARMFCERLVASTSPADVVPSEWIEDQPWYLFIWRHDPTIQSMLVMLDAIDEQFRSVDAAMAWARLTDPDDPAIWFLYSPLADVGSSTDAGMRAEDLYIKMNSRGKPLTDFETFKARFEKIIQWSPTAASFARKVDTTWSDILWHLRGDDDLIDDEFLRYLEFITEICEWRDKRVDGQGQPIANRAATVFGESNSQRETHLDFLFAALDVWTEHDITTTFRSFFADSAADATESTSVRLFFRSDAGTDDNTNLFEACCRSYGEMRGRTRTFSLGQSLMLYGVVLHLTEDTPLFPERARVVRNLIEASVDELRPDQMPRFLVDVERVIRVGDIASVEALNRAQRDDEVTKKKFVDGHAALRRAVHQLEDHELLRGGIAAFELDANSFERRAATFHVLMARDDLWPALLPALLACGEYQRQRTNSRPFMFGTDTKTYERAWRQLFTGASRDALQRTRTVLASLLDLIGDVETDRLPDALNAISQEYLSRCEIDQRFDWRYYMVKYPAMRSGGSSTYYAERLSETEPTAMGFSLCKLRGGGLALNGYYRDPYLLAVWEALEWTPLVEDRWFTGYETAPRRLPLTRSGVAIRCVPAGFELSPPTLEERRVQFETVCSALGADKGVVAVDQEQFDGRMIDRIDRVQFGTKIVAALLEAEL